MGVLGCPHTQIVAMCAHYPHTLLRASPKKGMPTSNESKRLLSIYWSKMAAMGIAYIHYTTQIMPLFASPKQQCAPNEHKELDANKQ